MEEWRYSEEMDESLHYFDAHCHLQDAQFDEDRERMLAESRAAGVSHFLVPATDAQSFDKTIVLLDEPNVYCALGIHPHSANEWNDSVRERISEKIERDEKVVAIGEIGLDYHYDFSPREVQQKAFAEQIELAIELTKPIVIHTRESEEDVFRIVEEHYKNLPADAPRGQFHCFSASVEWMERAIELGFHVSFTGNITFKKSMLSEVVEKTPIDRILLETDSPYLAPAPNRGKRNSPAMLPFIALKVAELKKLELSHIMRSTFTNTLSLFRIPAPSLREVALSIFFVLGLCMAGNASAQQPGGVTSPDSILTPERRKAEELRKKQQEELAKEAEQHRQDSIKAAQQALLDAQARAREQVRQDSIHAVEAELDAERHAAFLLTPQPWRAIGFGGNLGTASIHAAIIKQQLTPTSVFAYGLRLKTEVTRRLDLTLDYTHSVISDNFPQDSVYNYGPGYASKFPYRRDEMTGQFPYTPAITHLIQSEYLGASAIGLDFDYTITKPMSVIAFYFGMGYQHYFMSSSQNYLTMLDTLVASQNQSTYTQHWSRDGLDVLFGAKSEVELGKGYTMEPFAEIAMTFLFNGQTQQSNFVFQPDQTALIPVNVRAGITIYYGWWGVPRQQ